VIPAILMAAGASLRMGRPKALLRVGDRSFVRHILETLQRGGIHEAVVVVRPGQDAVIAEVAASGFGRAVLNPLADQGQLSSLIAGLDAIEGPGVDAALVTLVDVPLVAASTIRLLLARAAASAAPILRAVHQGRHGHPVIFKRQVFDALRRADPAAGAKAVVRASLVEDVEVDDPGVTQDIDTPADYARIFAAHAELREQAERLIWYHTVELPGGVTTRGIYDHRPYLPYYGLPADLHGKSVLDVGAASGFFTFELEGRGGIVTATDLPTWHGHDFGAHYQPELPPVRADEYLHEPFLVAHRARGSRASRKLTSIYDISPETTGVFDLVFCGSVLIHVSDPATALRRLQSVTREAAIISTVVHPLDSPDPVALFSGHLRGDTWWAPNRAGFEALIESAGFAGWEWYSEFALDYADGTPGPYHGVIRAWNTPERPSMLAAAGPAPQPPRPAPPSWEDRLEAQARELARLHGVIDGYQAMKFVRLVQWLHPYRQRIRQWFS
jgi:CTP:molybdopterin cytidylyltransferase MocA